jgi:hypothetical protein
MRVLDKWNQADISGSFLYSLCVRDVSVKVASSSSILIPDFCWRLLFFEVFTNKYGLTIKILHKQGTESRIFRKSRRLSERITEINSSLQKGCLLEARIKIFLILPLNLNQRIQRNI